MSFFLILSFLQQDASGRTQSPEKLLTDDDESKKEITPVRQTSHAPPYKPPQLHWLAAMPCLPSWSSFPTFAVSHTELRDTAALKTPCQFSMATPFLWKLSSQKLGFFLVSFGFIWGMMLLHFTIQQRASHENSAVLRQQILDLSKRYIKALAEENQSVMDGPYVGTMTAYGEYPPM